MNLNVHLKFFWNMYLSLSSLTFQTYRIDCVLLKLSTIITMERKSQFMFQELNEIVLDLI